MFDEPVPSLVNTVPPLDAVVRRRTVMTDAAVAVAGDTLAHQRVNRNGLVPASIDTDMSLVPAWFAWNPYVIQRDLPPTDSTALTDVTSRPVLLFQSLSETALCADAVHNIIPVSIAITGFRRNRKAISIDPRMHH